MEDVAIDACCLINLLSANDILPSPTSRPESRNVPCRNVGFSAFGLKLHVPAVIAKESYYLNQPDHEDGNSFMRAPIDLGPYFAHGILCECEVEGEHESGLLVQYATKLDDGEAACLAIAKSRGWSLATDDRLATRIASEVGVPVVTTTNLVQRWAVNTGASQQEISSVLLNIRRFARFVPRQNTEDAAWWSSHFPGDCD